MFNITKYKFYLYLSLRSFCKFVVNDGQREQSILFIETPETYGKLDKNRIILPLSNVNGTSVAGTSVKGSFKGSSINDGITHIKNTTDINELMNLSLIDDLDEFGKVLWPNIEALFALFSHWYSVDETFRTEVEKLFVGNEINDLLDMILNLPEFEEFMKFLQENGLKDVEEYDIDAIQDLLNIRTPPNVDNNLSECSSSSPPPCEKQGIKGFIETAKEFIDIDALQNLYNNKLETSETFQTLLDYLKSEKFLIIVHAVQCDTNYRKIRKHAIESGIDVEYIGQVLNKYLGW